MYKDKEGRKSVAIGTDGSEHAKNLLINTLKQEIFRSFAEKSKGSLGLFMKIIPFDILKNFLIPVEEVKKILHEDEIIPYSEVSEKDLPIDAKHTLEKYPQLKDFSYFREISGHLTFKVMVGTPHKKIVDTR